MAHKYIEEPENMHQEPPENVLQDGEQRGFSGCWGAEKAVEGRGEGAAQPSAAQANGQAAR